MLNSVKIEFKTIFRVGFSIFIFLALIALIYSGYSSDKALSSSVAKQEKLKEEKEPVQIKGNESFIFSNNQLSLKLKSDFAEFIMDSKEIKMSQIKGQIVKGDIRFNANKLLGRAADKSMELAGNVKFLIGINGFLTSELLNFNYVTNYINIPGAFSFNNGFQYFDGKNLDYNLDSQKLVIKR